MRRVEDDDPPPVSYQAPEAKRPPQRPGPARFRFAWFRWVATTGFLVGWVLTSLLLLVSGTSWWEPALALSLGTPLMLVLDRYGTQQAVPPLDAEPDRPRPRVTRVEPDTEHARMLAAERLLRLATGKRRLVADTQVTLKPRPSEPKGT